MNTLLIFIWIYAAMFAMSFWEAYVEGRNPWGKRKLGWTLKLTPTITLPAYHFYVFFVMWPLMLSLPLVIYGWNLRLFGILLSAYSTGMIIEDFGWFVVNPAVKLREFWTGFSDFYPWIKIRGKKILPVGYIVGPLIALASWYLFWR
jgi:hypothetical protein